MSNEKALKTAEFDSLSGIDSAQLEQRYQQLAKVKTLLFRQEAKNKRIKKIKSKLYHKLKKKDKQREENKVRAYLEEADPEAAAEIQHKEELKMAEERLRLRHGGHKKWARDMRRFKGKMEDTETREQYHEMMREKNALKDRQSRTRKTVEEVDSDDDSDSDDSDQSASELKRDAVKQI
jgi:U3 small nucleolar RNA-associated protein 14